MRRSRAWAALLLLTAASGCFGDDSDDDGPVTPTLPVFTDPLLIGSDHHHARAAEHNASYRMRLVAHEALTEQEAEAAGSHSIDLCGDWLVLGRETAGSYGVDLVHVAPDGGLHWVGKYRDPAATPGDRDVAWSDDCNWVFMANQGSTHDTSGIRIINAQDKSKPTFESLYRIPPGASAGVAGLGVSGAVHTVYAEKVGDTQYVYALNYGVHVLRLTDGVDGKKTLVLEGRYATADAEQLQAVNADAPDLVSTRRTIYGHDMTVYVEDGRTILYVAYAYDGLRIVDITDPATPMELGHWVPEDTPGAPHYVHSVKSYLRADGTRITIAGSETFEDRNTDTASPLWVLDTTDPAVPRLLATWTNPGRVGADHLLFSLHFYEVEDERLWLTHYHGGVWVLDLSTPTAPQVRGYYMPHEDTGYEPAEDCCFGWKWAGVPMTFDLKVRNGTAYAADFSTGLYAIALED